MSSSSLELSLNSNSKLQTLNAEAKECAKEGKVRQAIEKLNLASKICPSDKIFRRLKKLQDYLEEYGDDEAEEDGSMVHVGDKFYMYGPLYNKLYPYQHEGVLWLWKLYRKKKGGVLGDDMGLGKTIQVIAFISGMFDMKLINSALVIVPVSLIHNWLKEFDHWAPGIVVHQFHSSSKNERLKSLSKVMKRGGVLLTSYGMIMTNWEKFANYNGREFVWDYAILDEAHKIKNPTKTTKAVHAIPAYNRIALTGTPIQNNLRELWALYNFVHQGTLLGSLPTFKMQYETPITKGREKDATAGEQYLGSQIAESLRLLIQPYFLRRTKAEVLQSGIDKENQDPNVCSEAEATLQKKLSFLAHKNDFIVWLHLMEPQIQIYRDFTQLDHVKALLMSKQSPLVALTVLKKICDHPRLLPQRALSELGLDAELGERDPDGCSDDERAGSVSIESVSDDVLIRESGKLEFLLLLLHKLRSEGHRTLVFSQSRKMLDIIHLILSHRNWRILRLDGTMRKLEEREMVIQRFQTDPSVSAFLLTTQVGGVGLTLTGADRVVIFDPSWNPATDSQAVDRVYRIGQNKSVVIYRLITCGTVEEKIYRRQVFKDSITRQATGGGKDPHRYFTKQELRELFTLDDPLHSSTQVQLQEMHAHQRHTDTTLDEHIAFLYSLDIFGISDHDLLFNTETLPAEEVPEQDYIKKRVEMAQQIVQTEAMITKEEIEKTGTFARPFMLPLNSAKRQYMPDDYKRPVLPTVDPEEVIDVTRGESVTPFKQILTIAIDDDFSEMGGSNVDVNSSFRAMTVSEAGGRGNITDPIIIDENSTKGPKHDVKSLQKDAEMSSSSNSLLRSLPNKSLPFPKLYESYSSAEGTKDPPRSPGYPTGRGDHRRDGFVGHPEGENVANLSSLIADMTIVENEPGNGVADREGTDTFSIDEDISERGNAIYVPESDTSMRDETVPKASADQCVEDSYGDTKQQEKVASEGYSSDYQNNDVKQSANGMVDVPESHFPQGKPNSERKSGLLNESANSSNKPVMRITPLRLPSKLPSSGRTTSRLSPFQRALANAPEISFVVPIGDDLHSTPNRSAGRAMSDSSTIDSPVQPALKRRNVVPSESEDSDDTRVEAGPLDNSGPASFQLEGRAWISCRKSVVGQAHKGRRNALQSDSEGDDDSEKSFSPKDIGTSSGSEDQDHMSLVAVQIPSDDPLRQRNKHGDPVQLNLAERGEERGRLLPADRRMLSLESDGQYLSAVDTPSKWDPNSSNVARSNLENEEGGNSVHDSSRAPLKPNENWVDESGQSSSWSCDSTLSDSDDSD